jgi:hypothetical protein
MGYLQLFKNPKLHLLYIIEFSNHYMIYLHKILPTFVLPIMLVIIVILIGLIKNKKKLIYMYRAKLLFNKQGLHVIPYKVDYKVGRNKEMVIMDFLPNGDNFKLSETGLKEIIGRIFYLVKN